MCTECQETHVNTANNVDSEICMLCHEDFVYFVYVILFCCSNFSIVVKCGMCEQDLTLLFVTFVVGVVY